MNHQMKNSIISFLILLIILFSLDVGIAITDETFNPDLLEDCWRKEIDGIPIIYVSGSHYQMGYQYGYLLKEEIYSNCRAFFNRCPKDLFNLSDVLFEWLQITNFSLLPVHYQNEIQGLIDGAQLPPPTNTKKGENNFSISMFCSGISTWGSATKNDTLFHFRSLDSPLFKDPESNTFVHDNQAILIRNPVNGFRSLSPSVAGDLGLYGGINEKGISISWVSGFSNDIDSIGTPLGIRLKMALDYSNSIEETLSILQSNRTNALSYIISDANEPQGFVNEQTANLSYVGTWNDSSESQYPFWSLDHLVRRTNIFINTTISETQRTFYNPSFFPYLSSLFRLNQFYDNTYYFLSNVPSSGSWIHYNVLSKELERMHGQIDENNALPLLQRVYSGKTDFRYAFVTHFFNTGLDPWHQWVANPATGDITISFAQDYKTADETTIHQFNLYTLISSEKD
jgi:hypothetical protein